MKKVVFSAVGWPEWRAKINKRNKGPVKSLKIQQWQYYRHKGSLNLSVFRAIFYNFDIFGNNIECWMLRHLWPWAVTRFCVFDSNVFSFVCNAQHDVEQPQFSGCCYLAGHSQVLLRAPLGNEENHDYKTTGSVSFFSSQYSLNNNSRVQFMRIRELFLSPPPVQTTFHWRWIHKQMNECKHVSMCICPYACTWIM